MSAEIRIPRTYRGLIARLGLSQLGAGRFLKVHSRTAQRWAANGESVPTHVIVLLRLMVQLELTPADVERMQP